MNNIIVSIIIPTYNRIATIGRAINSVLSQSYQNFEILIIDDCSTDDTENYIKSHYSDNKKVRYYKLEKNSGACVARNKGIMLAQGKYIAFQDSDDEWLIEKLEKQVKILENKSYDAVFCQIIKYCDHKVTLIPNTEFNYHFMKEKIFDSNFISTQTILIKKESLSSIGTFDENLPRYQDWDLAIRMLVNLNVYYLNEPLVLMYIQKDSITRNKRALYKALKIILSKYEATIKANSSKIYSNHLRHLGLEFFYNGIEQNDLKTVWLKSLRYLLRALKYSPTEKKTWFYLFLLIFPIPRQSKIDLLKFLVGNNNYY